MLAAAGLFVASPWLGVVTAIVLTLVLSLAMWRWVERPWLRPDSAYRAG
jgi:peptidoglycan/LPS O-acetylase OafA/YrhL